MAEVSRILRLGIDARGARSEARSYQRELDRVQRSSRGAAAETDRAERGLRRMGPAFTAAAVAGAALTAAAIEVTRRLILLGAEVEETANKFDVVFGASAGRARAELEKLTETVPLTVSEMERMASGLQDMLVPMGVARSQAADLSVEMIALAGDIGSLNNVATGEVLAAMESSLAGMSRPMRRFGVDTREATLEAIALEEGLIRAGQEMDTTARAQAVLIAVQRDSADAMGDAERTMDSTSNTLRRMGRNVRQGAESLGVLASESVKASGLLMDLDRDARRLVDTIDENAETIRTTFTAAFDVATLAVLGLKDSLVLVADLLDAIPGMPGLEKLAEDARQIRELRMAQQEAETILEGMMFEGREIPEGLTGDFEQDQERLLELARQRADEAERRAEGERIYRAALEETLEREAESAETGAEAAAAREAAQEALDDEISLLTRAVEFEETRAEAVERLADIHAELLRLSRDQASLDEDRIRNLERMAEIAEAIAGLRPLSLDTPIPGRDPDSLPGLSLDSGALDNLEQRIQRSVNLANASVGFLADEIEGLAIADAVVGGVASVADSLFDVGEGGQAALRGLSDVLGGLQAIKTQGIGSVAGIGGVLGIAGGVAGILSSIINDDEVQRVRKATSEFNKALDQFVEGLADRTRFEQMRADAGEQALAVAQEMVEVWAQSFPDMVRDDVLAEVERIFREFDGDPEVLLRQLEEMFGDDAQAILDAYQQHMERIEEQRQKEIAAMEDDFRVRALVAQGRDEEAEALRRDIQRRKELAEAAELGDAGLVAFIESVHELEDAARAAAEAAEAAAEAERQRADFQGAFRAAAQEQARRTGDVGALRSLGLADIEATLAQFADVAGITDQQLTLLAATMRGNLNAAIEDMIEAEERRARQQAHATDQFLQDIRARELALQGDDAGALEAQLRADADAEMFRAQEMLRAGDISREAFERLVAVIEGELAQALEEAERAAREAAEAERFRAMVDKENLRVRLLVAQGRDEEAQRLRNQLEIMEAINDGRDAEYINLLRQIHAVELHNQAQEEAARAIEDTTRKLDGMTRFMNAPSGFFNPQLLRNQTIMGSDVFGVQQPQFGGGGSTSVRVESGAIVVHAAPGQDATEIAESVVVQLETRWQRQGRAGNNRLQTLGTG